MDLFERKIEIQVGGIKLTSHLIENNTTGLTSLNSIDPILGIDFNVAKTIVKSPNTGIFHLYNLNEDSSQRFAKKSTVTLNAGYVDTCQQLFVGDIKYVDHSKQGTTKVTTVECGDGANKYQSSIMNMSYRSGTNMKKMLIDAINKLGVKVGNSVQKILGPEAAAKFKTTTAGVVNQGRVSDIIDKLCNLTGLTWSIQDGELQVLEEDEVSKEKPILISQFSGLIGSPKINEKGVVKFRSQLQGGLKPGRMVQIMSHAITGYFKLIAVNHVGHTWGPDWFSECEGKTLKTLSDKI